MRRRLHHLDYIFAAFLPIFAVGQALAETCGDSLVLDSEQSLVATVAGEAGSRLHFQGNGANCPGGKDCDTKAYLLPNDKVFVVDNGGQWVCAYFRGAKRDTVGWLPRSALVIDRAPAIPVKQDWLGRWQSGRNYLLVDDKRGKRLFIQGVAFGEGLSLSDFDTETEPNGNMILYKHARCRITLRWLDGFILAANSLGCTGAGNSFDGVYKRTALTTDPADEPRGKQ